MRRRALLAVAGSLPAGIAGCATLPGGTATATPPLESRVDLAPPPDRPSTSTTSSVERFVHQFERAYVGRRVLARVERVVSFEFLSLGAESVVETDDGYRVEVGGFYGYAHYDDATATARIHGDWGHYVATYLVTEETVYRVVDGSDEIDPREDGERVTCPPAG